MSNKTRHLRLQFPIPLTLKNIKQEPLTMNAEFLFLLKDHIDNKTFIKLTISDKQNKQQDTQKVLIKPVQLKKGFHLSFVYRYATKDVTKNYLIEESIQEITRLMESEFKQALLFTTQEDIHFIPKAKKKINIKKATITKAADLSHDKNKKRLISTENNVYLQALKVTSPDGKVRKDMQDKYRQINKYIEIVDGALKELKNEKSLSIVDMGAGKGYLTFSLYDYLNTNLKIDASVLGIELRPQLVRDCNAIAEKASFDNLSFKEGFIESVELPDFDVLVALHACNTATDDAIYRGITSNAKVIICSPCCHKQVRQDMNKNNALQAITRFGILKERQAEIATDAIRALFLEAYGYKAQVFEFIATEHTPKNIIITAIKVKDVSEPIPEKMEEIRRLKSLIGLDKHYLELLEWS